MNSETVDLIATDPPFNTRRNRSGTAGHYVDNWKWGDTGKLPDQWAWNEVHPLWLDEIKDDNRALYEVIEATEHCHGQDIAAFLCFLSVRLLEMHRILKPTGSLYLHCDHTANAYIRMAMDAIFGAKNFRNEIIWQRASGRAKGSQHSAKSFGKDTDSIFYYAKTKESTFNGTYIEPDAKTVENLFPLTDKNGRYNTDVPLFCQPSMGPRPNLCYEYNGTRNPHPSGWRVSHQKLEEMDRNGEIVWREGKRPLRKTYAHNYLGKPIGNLWTDIPNLTSGNERTGSPDQKPLALYERIVLASSNEGDLVLDPFAGCATTLIAARNHGRRWVGIDRRPDARHHVVCRMLGIKAQEAEKVRQNPLYSDWLTARLAELETHYRTEAPIRTDEGDAAAPFLAPVFIPKEKLLLTHRQMNDFLVETFGLQCWGCDFKAPDERYLQLDHADPKRNGGSNDLHNRVLLCQPCNLAKSDRITLIQLRREKARDGHLTKPAGTKRGQDGHPIDLPSARQKCREALERHRQGQALENHRQGQTRML